MRSSSSCMPLWWLLSMLMESEAMLSLMLNSTADASKLTRRPCVITKRRSAKCALQSMQDYSLSTAHL